MTRAELLFANLNLFGFFAVLVAVAVVAYQDGNEIIKKTMGLTSKKKI